MSPWIWAAIAVAAYPVIAFIVGTETYIYRWRHRGSWTDASDISAMRVDAMLAGLLWPIVLPARLIGCYTRWRTRR